MRGPSQRGQESVGHCDDAKHIGLIGAAKTVNVPLSGGPAIDHDPGIVDQDVQVPNKPGGAGNTAAVGHVKHQQAWSREPTYTVSPADASCLAISRPMPFEAPVMSAEAFVMDR